MSDKEKDPKDVLTETEEEPQSGTLGSTEGPGAPAPEPPPPPPGSTEGPGGQG